jgi:hypothetical protein
MSHFIKKCKICGQVIVQCRCISENKTIIYDTCDECKKLERKENLYKEE